MFPSHNLFLQQSVSPLILEKKGAARALHLLRPAPVRFPFLDEA